MHTKWTDTKEKYKEKKKDLVAFYVYACMCLLKQFCLGSCATRFVFQVLWYIAPKGLESQEIMQHCTDLLYVKNQCRLSNIYWSKWLGPCVLQAIDCGFVARTMYSPGVLGRLLAVDRTALPLYCSYYLPHIFASRSATHTSHLIPYLLTHCLHGHRSPHLFLSCNGPVWFSRIIGNQYFNR